jgi:hypothetical protein
LRRLTLLLPAPLSLRFQSHRFFWSKQILSPEAKMQQQPGALHKKANLTTDEH